MYEREFDLVVPWVTVLQPWWGKVPAILDYNPAAKHGASYLEDAQCVCGLTASSTGNLSCPHTPALFSFLPGSGETAPWSAPPALTAGDKSTHGPAAEQDGHSLHPSHHPCAVFCSSRNSYSSFPDEWGK